MSPTPRLQQVTDALRERRWPWRLRALAYVRLANPRGSWRAIRASYRDDSDTGPALLHAYGLEFLRETMSAAGEAGIQPFIAFGTLLGHQRDGGFIRHDADIDFGLVPEDVGRIDALVAAMRRRGFVVRVNDDHEVSFYKPLFPTLLVDFFRFSRKGGQAVYYDTRGETVYEYAFPGEVLEGFAEARFMGQVDVLVPRQAELFLTASYGDWRTPRQAFDNVHGHPNRRVL